MGLDQERDQLGSVRCRRDADAVALALPVVALVLALALALARDGGGLSIASPFAPKMGKSGVITLEGGA